MRYYSLFSHTIRVEESETAFGGGYREENRKSEARKAARGNAPGMFKSDI
jgi:hypothetical protein